MPRSFVEQLLLDALLRVQIWFNWVILKILTTGLTNGLKQSTKLPLSSFFNGGQSVAFKEIISRYKSLYSGAFYERFVLGKWVAAQGLFIHFIVQHCKASNEGL